MLLWLIMIGGGGALALAFFAMRGPSASKALKRRIELVKERHGDSLAANAQAQIRKLFAQRASKVESYASTLIPKPALLRQRLEQTGKEISLAKYLSICVGIATLMCVALMFKPPVVNFFGTRQLMFDIGGVCGIVGMSIALIVSIVSHTAQLYREETVR